jgi:hypothetical protein
MSWSKHRAAELNTRGNRILLRHWLPQGINPAAKEIRSGRKSHQQKNRPRWQRLWSPVNQSAQRSERTSKPNFEQGPEPTKRLLKCNEYTAQENQPGKREALADRIQPRPRRTAGAAKIKAGSGFQEEVSRPDGNEKIRTWLMASKTDRLGRANRRHSQAENLLCVRRVLRD